MVQRRSRQRATGGRANVGAPEKKKIRLTAEERYAIAEYAKRPAVPPSLERAIEDYISRKVGKHWNDPVILERTRAAIRELKGEYWRRGEGREIRYATGYRAIAYLSYLLPVYYAQFRWLMGHMAGEGLLPDRMKILDAGTGPGVVPLAISDFVRSLGRGSACIYSIEREKEHLEAFRAIAHPYGREIEGVEIAQPIEADLKEVNMEELPRDLDLLVFSNVLNELSGSSIVERATLLRRYGELLSSEGTLAILEPADLENSTMLRRIVREAVSAKGMNIYEPCVSLWGRWCTTERCWSFLRLPDILPTSLMRALANTEDAFRYINTDVKFSYALLRKDGKTRIACRLGKGAKYAPLSSLSRHVERRINAAGAVMSSDLGEGEYHVFLFCDGTTRKPVFAILPEYQVSSSNRGLLEAGYGEPLGLRGVLVRYNRAEDAYNLLVQRGTQVERLVLSEACLSREKRGNKGQTAAKENKKGKIQRK